MQSVENFDVNKWEAMCRKYDRNRLGLKFNVDFSIQDGKMKIAFGNLDEKYFSPVRNIVIECAKGAIIFLNQQFLPTYVQDENYDKEYEKAMTTLKNHTEYLIRILLQVGFEDFLTEVDRQTSLLQIQYCIANLQLEQGKWKLASGEIWNGYGWEKDGVTYHYPLLQSICDALFFGTPELQIA